MKNWLEKPALTVPLKQKEHCFGQKNDLQCPKDRAMNLKIH